MDSQEQPLALDIPTVARRLGISKNTAYRAAADGKLPAIRIGKRFLVPVVQLEKWLAEGGVL